MSSRSSRIVLASAWLLAAVGAVPVLAQPPVGTPAWLRARLQGRLDQRALTAVERVIDSAYAEGIPAEPLVDRALEGAAKRAPSDLIVRAVRNLAVDLTTARVALGANSLPSELAAGADALRAGVDAKALQRLRHDRPEQPLAVALGVLSDLIARGVPVGAATQNVLDLTKAGIADEQLVAFRRDVERDVGMGASPASAATLRASALTLNLARDGTVIGPSGAGGAAPRKTRP
jgi:hypothetical protein